MAIRCSSTAKASKPQHLPALFTRLPPPVQSRISFLSCCVHSFVDSQSTNVCLSPSLHPQAARSATPRHQRLSVFCRSGSDKPSPDQSPILLSSLRFRLKPQQLRSYQSGDLFVFSDKLAQLHDCVYSPPPDNQLLNALPHNPPTWPRTRTSLTSRAWSSTTPSPDQQPSRSQRRRLSPIPPPSLPLLSTSPPDPARMTPSGATPSIPMLRLV